MSAAALNFKILPISERIQLAEDIWDSIAEDTPGEWPLSANDQAELERRYAAHLADPASSIPWSDVRAALFNGQA